MVNLQEYLEKNLRSIISAWNEDDIYAISFFIYANEAYRYNRYSNVTKFSVSYNTEVIVDIPMNFQKNVGIMLIGVKMKYRL